MSPDGAERAGGDTAKLERLIGEAATAEITQLLADARDRAQRIRATAEEQVQDIRSTARREGEERGRVRAAALLSDADAQGRMEVLRAREAELDAAIDLARQQLAAVGANPGSAALAVALIREGLAAFPAGPVRVRLPASWADLLSAAERGRLEANRWSLEVVTEEIAGGGVILETADRRLRFDNSFAARVRRRRDELRRLAADTLFGKDATGDGDSPATMQENQGACPRHRDVPETP